VFHLLRSADRRILRSFFYPIESQGAHSIGGDFLDNSRFLMLGDSISVVDAAAHRLLKRVDLDHRAMSAVVARDGSRFWTGVADPPGLLEFNSEPASCGVQEPNPAMLFSADGSFESTSDGTVLTGHGSVMFKPGKIGQAFFLDGNSYLSADSTGYYQLYRYDFSIALYVKWGATEHELGIRMLISEDNRFVFQAWPGGASMKSSSTVAPNVWYHVTVTKTDDLLTLYVNGKAEASGKLPAHLGEYQSPLFLGAYEPGRASLHGWLDEVAFYNRGLTAGEVDRLYQLREAGACRLN
jgi:hypothetical protein